MHFFRGVDVVENMLTRIREGESPDLDLKDLMEKLTALEENKPVQKSVVQSEVKKKNKAKTNKKNKLK